MERGPSQPERHGTDPEAKDKKRKSKKRGLAVPLPVETDAAGKADTAEKPAKPSVVDEALARLAVARKEAAEAAKESDEPAAEVATDAEPDVQETTEPEAEAEAVDEPESVSTSESDDAEAYEPLPGYELEPTELGAGEVVIQLQGDAPVAERVISLHEPVAPQSETV